MAGGKYVSYPGVTGIIRLELLNGPATVDELCHALPHINRRTIQVTVSASLQFAGEVECTGEIPITEPRRGNQVLKIYALTPRGRRQIRIQETRKFYEKP